MVCGDIIVFMVGSLPVGNRIYMIEIWENLWDVRISEGES